MNDRYVIEPVGNEEYEIKIVRIICSIREEITLSELEDDFNIYKPLSIDIKANDRVFNIIFETVANNHAEKEAVCDKLAEKYGNHDDDDDEDPATFNPYLFMNTHEVFWRYCEIRRFIKMVEKESKNMYWRSKVEGDCPVMMEKLVVGECCKLACNHIISTVAYRKIRKSQTPLCPLCRGYMGNEINIIV